MTSRTMALPRCPTGEFHKAYPREILQPPQLPRVQFSVMGRWWWSSVSKPPLRGYISSMRNGFPASLHAGKTGIPAPYAYFAWTLMGLVENLGPMETHMR